MALDIDQSSVAAEPFAQEWPSDQALVAAEGFGVGFDQGVVEDLEEHDSCSLMPEVSEPKASTP